MPGLGHIARDHETQRQQLAIAQRCHPIVRRERLGEVRPEGAAHGLRHTLVASQRHASSPPQQHVPEPDGRDSARGEVVALQMPESFTG